MYLNISEQYVESSRFRDQNPRQPLNLEKCSIVEETQSKGETAVIEKKSYIIYVIPIHNANNETPYPHQRIMIYSKNAAITKEQAISAISKICRIPLTDIINIGFLQIDSKGWICQAWNYGV